MKAIQREWDRLRDAPWSDNGKDRFGVWNEEDVMEYWDAVALENKKG